MRWCVWFMRGCVEPQTSDGRARIETSVLWRYNRRLGIEDRKIKSTYLKANVISLKRNYQRVADSCVLQRKNNLLLPHPSYFENHRFECIPTSISTSSCTCASWRSLILNGFVHKYASQTASIERRRLATCSIVDPVVVWRFSTASTKLAMWQAPCMRTIECKWMKQQLHLRF